MNFNLKMNCKSFFQLSAAFLLTFGVILNLTAANNIAPKKKAIKVLMIGGGNAHDFIKWYKETDLVTLAEGGLADVIYTEDTDKIIDLLPEMDVLFIANNKPIPDPATREAIFAFADAGKGIVLAHAGMWYSWRDWPEFNTELVSGGSRGHDRYGEFNVDLTDKKHPVTKGVPSHFSLKDELYYQQVDSKGPGIEVLAEASTEGKDPFPSVFIVKHAKAKIVGIALGHDGAAHNLEAYKTLIRNAVKWASK
ncbi:ThuA domain-containing protein [Algoriphagus halophytocola]|uniref:ThuA domain-containing protein n=1 Tax=Algoriphagus halophytocola TaxID=2991499 RepID=A0ABY6MCI8_9BACT|nr:MULTISPECIES: ThuA domain-containing protein [unclassified Algoriphagus]UZD21411.1 ThuA domain-containing protein [Algoriphagus sp. TR-M5]WBL42624.1 ThuA domain-containing protein [Algoriphagus sp. TR-M9]